MICTIHQPEFLSYYGFYAKVLQSELLIILDDVQFVKNYFHNRNKILLNGKEQYITVPVHHNLGTPINRVEIVKHHNYSKKILGTVIQAYRKSPYFNEVYPILELIIGWGHTQLSELNIQLIKSILRYLQIDIPIYLSSDIDVGDAINSDRILKLCKEVGASKYISGIGGKNYLNVNDFKKENIEVEFFNKSITYNQFNSSEFVDYMSIIDGLFNYGIEFKNLLK